MRRAAILLSTIVLAACNMVADAQEPRGGGGPSVNRSFDVGGFDSVSLSGSQNVIVAVGPAHSVRAEGDADIIDKLEIEVKDGNLKIGMKKGNWSWGRNHKPVTIYVTAPVLTAAAIGGSGDMQIDKVEGGSFAASIGGSGDMRIGSLRVGEANFNVAGSGEIKAAGAVGKSHVAIAGSGDIDAGELESGAADISIVGSGGVRLKAMQTANVSIMGSGDVVVTGPAKCSVSKMGSGDVRCETRA